MNIKIFIMFVCLCCISSSSGADFQQGIHDYYSISSSPSYLSKIRFNEKDKEIIYTATYVKYNDCSSSYFFCFESPKLSFCVPKVDVFPESWRCGEEEILYRNAGIINLPAFGDVFQVMVISTDEVNYYYSKKFGVVMFVIEGGSGEVAYWSAGRNGFGVQVK